MEMDNKQKKEKERLDSVILSRETGRKEGSVGFIADAQLVGGVARKRAARVVRDEMTEEASFPEALERTENRRTDM